MQLHIAFMWRRFGRSAGWIVVLLGFFVAAEKDASAQGGSGRRLGDTDFALSPQQSLLLKVQSRLHDPLNSLASWNPWFGPCEEGGDSFEDGWEFVKCDGGTATQLYETQPPAIPSVPSPSMTFFAGVGTWRARRESAAISRRSCGHCARAASRKFTCRRSSESPQTESAPL